MTDRYEDDLYEPGRDPTWALRSDAGGYGEGNDDADVLAGAFRRPKGSLRFDSFDMSKIEPIDHDYKAM